MIPENKMELKHHNFLLSNWYSGATVLSVLLNNHRQITCNGEALPFQGQNFDELICSCGSPITKCEFYKYAAEHFLVNDLYDKRCFSRIPIVSDSVIIQRIFHSFFHGRYFRDAICALTPGYNDTIDNFIKMHEKFYSRACHFSNSSIYLDGTKSPRRAELFAKYSNKPVRILYCIRDGRKFTASYMKVHKLSEECISMVAKKWVDYIKMVELLTKRYPRIEIKEIRHEDLCRDKENTIKEVCEFLGADYYPDIFNFGNEVYHLLGNTMRNKFDGTIYENDKWKSAFSKEIFNNITKIQKDYLIKYEYI